MSLSVTVNGTSYVVHETGEKPWGTDTTALLQAITNLLVYVRSGTGTPEGVVTANVGSIYLRTDGGTSTTLYVKESGTGNTGWVAK